MSLQTRLASLISAIGVDINALFSRSLPSGGTAGQVLTKNGTADYDSAWSDPGQKITVSSTAPASPALNDLWLEI